MPDIINFEAQHLQDLDGYSKEIKNAYNQAIRDVSRLAEGYTVDPKEPFSFAAYPALNKKVNKILLDMAGRLIRLISGGTKDQWLLSNDKNDELVQRIMGKSGLTEQQLSRYMNRNLEALNVFQDRKISGLNLSDKIYKQGEQFKTELELALDVGLGEGKSANALSRDIRGYLENPDKLFRRVRDKHGVLRLSQAAKAYNPGRGVYRSSYKNAQRLARTEINMAYRVADIERWGTLDFVVGYEVKRSNHPYPCVLCDSMVGKYPKTFIFKGWHPNCRCYMIAIMATDKEIDQLIDNIINEEINENFRSVNEVTKLPAGHIEYIRDNKERLLRATTQPYFIQDNYKGKTVAGGWKLG